MADPRHCSPIVASSQGTQGSNQYRRTSFHKCDRSRRSWSDKEEVALMAALKELVAMGWKSDNGFRSGCLNWVEASLRKEFPTTDLKVNPHLQSKMTAWKKCYYSLSGILERSGVGFNTNGDFKIDCDDDQWDQIVKHDSNAKHMRGKSWPFWEDWKEVFGKDRATGGGSEGVKHATRQSMHDPIPEENIVDLGLNNDYHVSFDDFISMEEVQQQQVRGSSSGEGSTTHNEKETRAPKKSTLKRKSSDDGDELLTLLRTLHAETNSRLETLSIRIGYEMDLGKARQEVFRQLCNIPGLSEMQTYDLTDIIGKENSRLEIFMGLPEASKPGYVMRVLEKEGLM